MARIAAMEADTQTELESARFLAELWREVGHHSELDESVRRIAVMLGARFPIDEVIVRRVDAAPMRLTTVACGTCDPSQPGEALSTRTDCDAQASSALSALLERGRAELIVIDSASPLPRALLPHVTRGGVIACPLTSNGRPVALTLLLSRRVGALNREHAHDAQAMIEPLTVAFENDQRLHELARMREALEADRQALLSKLERQDISDTIVGESAGLSSVMERVEKVAPTDAPVLILGETGSGKEVIARAIHARSRRASGPVVRVNCGAIPAQLVDSELFGHERGSFTGAVATRKGWFERADGGTLFLDEIGELPLEAQVRLLRVLQDGSLERVGGHQAIHVDVRIVAATHRNLETMVAEEKFREDLWYRISTFPIRLPALRERPQDIPTLAAHFAKRAGVRLGGSALSLTERDVALLTSYPWPGNVRELAAVIERAAILGNGKRLDVATALGGFDPAALLLRKPTTVPPPSLVGSGVATARSSDDALSSLDIAMVAHIEQALRATHGRIEGPFGAARMLDVNPHTLRARMRKLGIEWSRFRRSAGA